MTNFIEKVKNMESNIKASMNFNSEYREELNILENSNNYEYNNSIDDKTNNTDKNQLSFNQLKIQSLIISNPSKLNVSKKSFKSRLQNFINDQFKEECEHICPIEIDNSYPILDKQISMNMQLINIHLTYKYDIDEIDGLLHEILSCTRDLIHNIFENKKSKQNWSQLDQLLKTFCSCNDEYQTQVIQFQFKFRLIEDLNKLKDNQMKGLDCKNDLQKLVKQQEKSEIKVDLEQWNNFQFGNNNLGDNSMIIQTIDCYNLQQRIYQAKQIKDDIFHKLKDLNTKIISTCEGDVLFMEGPVKEQARSLEKLDQYSEQFKFNSSSTDSIEESKMVKLRDLIRCSYTVKHVGDVIKVCETLKKDLVSQSFQFIEQKSMFTDINYLNTEQKDIKQIYLFTNKNGLKEFVEIQILLECYLFCKKGDHIIYEWLRMDQKKFTDKNNKLYAEQKILLDIYHGQNLENNMDKYKRVAIKYIDKNPQIFMRQFKQDQKIIEYANPDQFGMDEIKKCLAEKMGDIFQDFQPIEQTDKDEIQKWKENQNKLKTKDTLYWCLNNNVKSLILNDNELDEIDPNLIKLMTRVPWRGEFLASIKNSHFFTNQDTIDEKCFDIFTMQVLIIQHKQYKSDIIDKVQNKQNLKFGQIFDPMLKEFQAHSSFIKEVLEKKKNFIKIKIADLENQNDRIMESLGNKFIHVQSIDNLFINKKDKIKLQRQFEGKCGATNQIKSQIWSLTNKMLDNIRKALRKLEEGKISESQQLLNNPQMKYIWKDEKKQILNKNEYNY